MSLVLLVGPPIEPVSLEAAKAHLRVDHDAEDTYIAALIGTSRLQIEAALGLALIQQTWRYLIDDWPQGPLELPLHPVSAIAAVKVRDADGSTRTASPSSYALDGLARPPRVCADWSALPQPGVPTNGIEIEFTAGFGSAGSDVPQPVRHALLLLVAHWFECREATEAGLETRIPESVSALLAPYRVVRL